MVGFILRPSEGKLLKDSKQRCDIIRCKFGKDTWTAKSVFWREARIGAGISVRNLLHCLGERWWSLVAVETEKWI